MTNRYNILHLEPEFKQYLRESSLSSVSIKNYLSDIRHFIGWIYTQKKEPVISSELLSSYIETLSADAIPQVTINRRMSSLKKYLSFLADKHYINPIPNPFLFPPENNSSDQIPSSNQSPEVTQFSMHTSVSPLRIIGYLIFIVIVAIAGITTLYSYYTSKIASQQVVVEAQPNGRTLIFSGQIADQSGEPITTKTDITFSLYPDSESTSPLYSGSCVGEQGITPDISGYITIRVGADCGMKPVPQEIFWNQQRLYMGISVASDNEMRPRTPIPLTDYALNAQQLSGLTVGEEEDSIPYINEAGEIVLDALTPAIVSTTDSSPLLIESAKDLTVRAQYGGTLKLEALQSGTIEFYTGGAFVDVPQMTIAPYGNVGIGTFQPEEFTLQVAGDIGPESGSIYNLGSQTTQWATVYAERFIQNGLPLCDAQGNNCPFTSSWLTTEPYIYQESPGNKLGLGTNTLSEIESQLYVTRDIASGATGKALAIFNQTENQDIFTASASGSLRFVIQNSGNTGIGTINPSARLDVSGGQTKLEVSTQYTQRLCHSGTDTANAQNVYIGDCTSTSADIAEVYGTDDNSLTSGYIVSVGKSGIIEGSSSRAYVLKSNGVADPRMIGVVSTQPYDVFGNTFKPDEKTVPVALTGRVPVRISPRSEPISRGDPLTSSEDPGLAQKATHPGRIIGLALEDWQPAITDNILVFINPSYFDPLIRVNFQGELSDLSPFDDTKEYVYDGVLAPHDNTLSTVMQQLINDVLNNSKELIISQLTTTNKIYSPIVETETLIASGEAQINTVSTNTIRPQENDLTIDLSYQDISSRESELTRLIILGRDGTEAAQIDSAGNAALKGTLRAANGVFEGSTSAHLLQAETGALTNLQAQSATITGTLKADSIESSTISHLRSKIDNIEASSSGLFKSLSQKGDSDVESLTKQINDIQAYIGTFTTEKLPPESPDLSITDEINISNIIRTDQTPDIIDNNLLTSDITDGEFDSLTVYDTTSLYRAHISNSLTAGNILLHDSQILSLADSLSFSALSTIEFFDGAASIDRSGTIITTGEIIARGGIRTDTIAPSSSGITIQVDPPYADSNNYPDVNNSETLLATQSGKLIIANAAGDTVSQITNTGDAQFNTIGLTASSRALRDEDIVSASDNFRTRGIYAPAISATDSVAGVGRIPESAGTVLIYSDKITDDSLIYLTPTGETDGIQLSLIRKESCSASASESCRPYFRVAASVLNIRSLDFNWLIIN